MDRKFDWRICGAAALLAATVSVPANAQDYGDAKRGFALALRVCIACHGVHPGEDSVNPLAPPFAVIAQSPGMSPMALNVAMLSPHRAMPNMAIEAQERADVIAYIMSLKTH